MKKLFSAATSLVMAATMVSAVAPVVAGAADAKKGVSLLAYKDATLQDGVTSEGSVVTVSADAIAAGDVTIPVGVYFTEGTPDLLAAAVQATVNSTDGDAKSVKFEAVQPTDNFFDTEKSFTFADGTTFTTQKVVAFAGSYNKRAGYKAHGVYQIAVTEKQDSASTPNAYFGLSWTNGTKAYEWSGEKSDTYPIAVFKVNLPKGLKEGTYTLDYCNYITAYKNPSCLLETTTKYDAINNNNLDLNTLTIKVGDSAGTTTTTTKPSATTTTTTTTKKPDSTTTTTTTGGGDVNVTGDFIVDFINPSDPNGYWHANAGETIDVDMHVTSPENKKPTGFDFAFTVEGGITVSEIYDMSPAFGGATMVVNAKALTFNGTCTGSDGHGVELVPDEAAAYLTFDIPAGTPDGLYEIKFTKAIITDDSKPSPLPYKVGTKSGYIQVGDAVSTTTTKASSTTTTTTTTTTKAPGSSTTTTKATTTTTTTTSVPGTKLYGDTNCDGVVKINDVVLLNKYLNDNKSYAITEQGKINADCFNPKDGKELTADDSDAIIKSIVHLVELPVKQ